MRLHKILIQLILVSSICITTIGCVSYPGNEFLQYRTLQPDNNEPKAEISYDIFVSSDGAQKENPKPITMYFQEETRNDFTESNLFSKLNTTEKEKYHLSLHLNVDHKNIVLSIVSAIFCGLSLTIIPAYMKEDYVLSIKVKKEEQVIKEYKYSNYIDHWVELFLFRYMSTPMSSPDNAEKIAMRDMLLAFISDLKQDKLLTSEK